MISEISFGVSTLSKYLSPLTMLATLDAKAQSRVNIKVMVAQLRIGLEFYGLDVFYIE